MEPLWPAGHFYSPLPSLEDIAHRETAIFDQHPIDIPGINLREDEQWKLLDTLKQYYDTQPFTDQRQPHLRYCFSEADSFSYADAIFLHCMIRHLQPKRIVEVGCGWSTCAILDTNDLFYNGEISTEHIDPYFDTIDIPMQLEEARNAQKICLSVQDVPLDTFDTLEKNDILFIDSSHVCKTGSDVEHLYGEVLPRLQPGVAIHVHDVFYPFEYPKEWVYQGRAWNELYLLRSFLQCNNAFSVSLFLDYLWKSKENVMEKRFPLMQKNSGGSFWMQRL